MISYKFSFSRLAYHLVGCFMKSLNYFIYISKTKFLKRSQSLSALPELDTPWSIGVLISGKESKI